MNPNPTVSPPPSQTDKGRHSCLTAFFVVLGVIALFGGVLAGLMYLFGRSGAVYFGQGLGVVEVKGIVSEAEPILKTLVEYRRSDKIKAIILRVDSPGGAVGPTQEIYREVLRTRQEKKVVASLGTVAASGGLYVASAADKVVANAGTVTGSIGVVMQYVNIESLLDKVGFSSVTIKSGPYKDLGSPLRPMTEDEKGLLKQMVNQVHRQFVQDVAQSRSLPVEEVAAVADGRIFTGEEALGLGLVDELGNFQDAVELAKKVAGLRGRVQLVYPEKERSWLWDLIRGKTEVKLLPEWVEQPFRFQYLYLPGL